MKEKIEEILESVDLLRCIETNPSNFWDSASYDDLVERLTTLIQEEREEAIEGFVEWLFLDEYGEPKEKIGYLEEKDVVVDLMGNYLSQQREKGKK